jgi:hypothetical protein
MSTGCSLESFEFFLGEGDANTNKSTGESFESFDIGLMVFPTTDNLSWWPLCYLSLMCHKSWRTLGSLRYFLGSSGRIDFLRVSIGLFEVL